jgi:hypothetical protein
MHLSLRPRQTAAVLAVITLLLMAAHVATQYARLVLGRENLRGLVHMFDLDRGGNIPAFYSVIVVLFAALCLWLIADHAARSGRAYARHWKILAILLAIVALHEGTQLHHLFVIRPETQEQRLTWGPFYFSWTLSYGVAVLVVGLIYLPFILHLPRATRYLVLVAGLLYVSGALGMEMVAGLYIAEGGTRDFAFTTMTAVEEFLEMTGMLVFIYALMDYMAHRHIGLQLGIKPDPQPAPLMEEISSPAA